MQQVYAHTCAKAVVRLLGAVLEAGGRAAAVCGTLVEEGGGA